MAKTVLKIEGMMCEGCVSNVKKALEETEGVGSAAVDLKKGTATVMHDGVPDEKLIGAVVDIGFRASVKKGLFS
ncbi:MAG: heavy-metal-associated domain-containing protein [Candidatus Methanomethylophilaceae archaeon]|nr:heavy-metal-associated domain-containing protein [Candidatus Methanomethylophilaceae archaeon]